MRRFTDRPRRPVEGGQAWLAMVGQAPPPMVGQAWLGMVGKAPPPPRPPHLWVVVVRDCLYNGACTLGGVARLEDAATHKHTIHAQLGGGDGGGGRGGAGGRGLCASGGLWV